MDNVQFRNENKFIIDYSQAAIIKDQVASLCILDSHVGSSGYYDIKSIYYDTIDDKYYHENAAGANVRHKYRMRTYNNDSSFINLERKSTEAGLKHKDSTIITLNQADEIIAGNIMVPTNEGQKILSEFQAEHLNYYLTPKVIVAYRRIPYVHSVGNVRITFDYHMSASDEIERFWDDSLNYIPIIDDNFLILEVKYDGFLPSAIREMLNDNGILDQTAFSKYTMAREAFGL